MKSNVIPPKESNAFISENIWPSQEEVVGVEIVDHIPPGAIELPTHGMKGIEEVAHLVTATVTKLLIEINPSKETVADVMSRKEEFVKTIVSQITPAFRLHLDKY